MSRKHNESKYLDRRVLTLSKPAAESCSQTILLQLLKNPPESGSLHSQTGGTPHQPAALDLRCSGPLDSGSPQPKVCFGRGCVEAREGGAEPSFPFLTGWCPSVPQPQWEKPDDFQGLD